MSQSRENGESGESDQSGPASPRSAEQSRATEEEEEEFDDDDGEEEGEKDDEEDDEKDDDDEADTIQVELSAEDEALTKQLGVIFQKPNEGLLAAITERFQSGRQKRAFKLLHKAVQVAEAVRC